MLNGICFPSIHRHVLNIGLRAQSLQSLRLQGRPKPERQVYGDQTMLLQEATHACIPLLVVYLLLCILHLVCNRPTHARDQEDAQPYRTAGMDIQHLLRRRHYLYAFLARTNV